MISGVDGNRFVRFVRNSLSSMLQPFDGISARSVVILDNASIHHVSVVAGSVRTTGALIPTFIIVLT